MFRVILETQWKWTRGVLLAITLIAFALPFLALRTAARAMAERNARDVLLSMEPFGVFFAIAAGTTGMLIAGMAWNADHAGRHVYALSLPIARWRYVAMRFGAGALTLTPPVIALWLGGVIVMMSTQLPTGLHSYPAALAVRFALAMLIAYAIFFALASGTRRTTGILLGAVVAMILIDVGADMMGAPIAPFGALLDVMMNWSGTFGVFNGRWMLIDV